MSAPIFPKKPKNAYERISFDLEQSVEDLHKAKLLYEDHMFHAQENAVRISILKTRVARLQDELAQTDMPPPPASWLQKLRAALFGGQGEPSFYMKHKNSNVWIQCTDREWEKAAANPNYVTR